MDTLTGTSRVNQISVNGGLPGSSLAVGLHRIYIEHRVRLSRAESSRVRGALGARRHERRRSAERPAIRWSADRPAMLLDLLAPPGRCSGCWPHDGEVDGCRRREAVFRSRRRRLDAERPAGAATRWRRGAAASLTRVSNADLSMPPVFHDPVAEPRGRRPQQQHHHHHHSAKTNCGRQPTAAQAAPAGGSVCGWLC